MTLPPRPAPVALGDGVTLLDLDFQGFAGAVAAYLLRDGDDAVLVETGPGSTLPALHAGLAAAGVEPAQLTGVVVTHIHLDHAGAAGTLLADAPRARFYVHPAGARTCSTRRSCCAARRASTAPTWSGCGAPSRRCRPSASSRSADGDRVPLGGRTLVARHTPGHAVHHVALHDRDTGDVYTGDVAGVRLGGLRYVRPPTPPPDVDLVAWQRSIATLRACAPRRLLLTHFGAFDDAAWHLDDLTARLHYWAGWIEGRLDAAPTTGGASEASDALVVDLTRRAAEEVRRAGGGAHAVEGYELATPAGMTVAGIARWMAMR
jgi:glyoxylase-like metal-dependent hydrolase (beta-lactamase superfamily II)